MKYSYDLHIHTALSPCADNEMTPNDIVGMAYLNGLDIIAITDHNSALNVQAVIECAKERGICVVPGLEVESVEGVHIVCLFGNAEQAMDMSEIVHERLAGIPNNEAFFGCQYIMNVKDEIVGREDALLVASTDMTSEEVFETVDGLGGIAYFAHIDRPSNGVLSVLGVFPENVNTKIVEVNDSQRGLDFAKGRHDLKDRMVILSSDAHKLHDINDRKNFFDMPWQRDELDAGKVIEWIKGESQWN